jgi:integrase
MAVRKLKNGKWLADFYINGKRVKRQKKTKREAEDYIVKRRTNEPTTMSSEMHDNYSRLHFSEISTKYLKEHLLKSKAAANKSYIKKLEKKWGEYKLSSITPAEVRTWVKELFDSSYEISTVEKYLVYFKRIFNYAIEMEVISLNPIRHIKFKKEFKKKNKRNVTMNEKEFIEFYALFEKSPWYIKSIVMTLWHTGMRIGEALSLEWSEVKIDDGVVVFDANKVKEGKTRTIGLEKELLAILVELKSINDKKGAKGKNHVFGVTKESALSYAAFYRNYKEAVNGSKYSHFNIHDLRHSYTKRKRQQGHDKEVIKTQMGHTTDSMFQHYNDIDEDEVRQMSGFDEEKAEAISPEVEKLVEKMEKEGVPLNTLYTVVRSKIR